MRSQYFRFAVLLVSALALGGCGTITNPGAPDQSFNIDDDIQDLEKVFKDKKITVADFYDNESPENRNAFIAARLTLTNIQYIKFIRKFAVSKAQLDTAVDMLTIGVDLAITLVGSATTKAILGAISAGTTASKLSIDKNFYYEKTVPVLITAMNAERKKALIPILIGRNKSLKNYSFEKALSDLHIYYQAGTFIGALQAIQKDSGAKEDKAEKDIVAVLAFSEITSEIVTKQNLDLLDKILDNIEKLTDMQAIEMAKKPPVENEEYEKLIELTDPQKLRETNGSIAKDALNKLASLTVKNPDDLKALSEAIDKFLSQ